MEEHGSIAFLNMVGRREGDARKEKAGQVDIRKGCGPFWTSSRIIWYEV